MCQRKSSVEKPAAKNRIFRFSEKSADSNSNSEARLSPSSVTQKGQFVQTGGGRAQAAKGGQQDTMHNTLRYTITM